MNGMIIMMVIGRKVHDILENAGIDYYEMRVYHAMFSNNKWLDLIHDYLSWNISLLLSDLQKK